VHCTQVRLGNCGQSRHAGFPDSFPGLFHG
jgi:hypothetical protein